MLKTDHTMNFITLTLADGQNIDEILLDFTKVFDIAPPQTACS